MVHDLEPQRVIGPVDGGDVEKEVEGELRLQAFRHRQQRGGLEMQHQHAMLHAMRLDAGARRDLLLHEIEKRCGHDQNDSFTMRCLPLAIFSCSCMMPSITISGRGGHPGTYTSTGMMRSMPGQRRVVLIESAAGRADAEGHDPLRFAHLLVHLEQNRRLLLRDRADHHEQVGLTGREAGQGGAEAVGVVGRGADGHELHGAAGGHERVGKQRELARPAHQFILARREVLERRVLGVRRRGWRAEGVHDGKRFAVHDYSVTASRMRAL